ncbi:MAG: nucleoside deaminase [Rhodanobacteraceae bacterium]
MIELSLPDWINQAFDVQASYPDRESQVRLAIELSRRNVAEGSGGPFGAAVFDADGTVVAVGVNRVLPQTCSLAHAEIMAYMGAQKRLGRARINEDGRRYTLATSAQPCCQCYGATIWAGIDCLLMGARAEDVMRLTEFDEGPLPTDWVGELEQRGIEVGRDICREQACEVLAEYSRQGGEHY